MAEDRTPRSTSTTVPDEAPAKESDREDDPHDGQAQRPFIDHQLIADASQTSGSKSGEDVGFRARVC